MGAFGMHVNWLGFGHIIGVASREYLTAYEER